MRIIPGAPLRLVLATALAVASVQALTVIPPPLEELVATAVVVVDGTVTGVRLQIEHSDVRPAVYTIGATEVADTTKGAPAVAVELRVPNGGMKLGASPANEPDKGPAMNRPGMEDLRNRI